MTSFVDDNPYAQPRLVQGYPTLAQHMSSTPEISIFKRFETLNRQNLLYLQAELTSLEKQLRNFEAESTKCDESDPRSQYSRDWEWMTMTDERSTFNPQWKLFLRIRGVLKEYSKHSTCTSIVEWVSHRSPDETLLQQATITSIPKPETYNLNYLQSWLSRPSCGNFPIIGPDHTIWKETPPQDLLSLQSPTNSDPFSRWAITSFIPTYHRLLGHHFRDPDPESQTEYIEYNSTKIARVASFISTIVAVVMLIAPVAVLWKISSIKARLGTMAGFTVVFSLLMAGLTSAKRSDIFAATAAWVYYLIIKLICWQEKVCGCASRFYKFEYLFKLTIGGEFPNWPTYIVDGQGSLLLETSPSSLYLMSKNESKGLENFWR